MLNGYQINPQYKVFTYYFHLFKINTNQDQRSPAGTPTTVSSYLMSSIRIYLSPLPTPWLSSQTEIATIREHFHAPAFRQCVLPSPISTTSFPSNLSQGVYKFIPQVGDPFPAYPSGHRSSPVYKIYTGMCNGFSYSTSGK